MGRARMEMKQMNRGCMMKSKYEKIGERNWKNARETNVGVILRSRGRVRIMGDSISAPGFAFCYFSCAEGPVSGSCSHAIVTLLVWWHGTWSALPIECFPVHFFPPLLKTHPKYDWHKKCWHRSQFLPKSNLDQMDMSPHSVYKTSVWTLKKKQKNAVSQPS